jgi:transcriptional regulator with XRE-family HTH domain
VSKQDAIQLGRYLRKAREAKGLSQAALGRAIGVPASTVMRLERGTIGLPDPAKLHRLARELDLEVEELMVRHPAVKQGLPGFPVYLRAKYGMSEEAIAEAEAFFSELAARDKQDHNRSKRRSGGGADAKRRR